MFFFQFPLEYMALPETKDTIRLFKEIGNEILSDPLK